MRVTIVDRIFLFNNKEGNPQVWKKWKDLVYGWNTLNISSAYML